MEHTLCLGVKRRLDSIKSVLQHMEITHLGKELVLDYIDLLDEELVSQELSANLCSSQDSLGGGSGAFISKESKVPDGMPMQVEQGRMAVQPEKSDYDFSKLHQWALHLSCFLLVLHSFFEDVRQQTTNEIKYELRLQRQVQLMDIEIGVRGLVKNISIDHPFLEAALLKWNLQGTELHNDGYEQFRALMNDMQPYATYEVFCHHYRAGDYEYVLDLGQWLLMQYGQHSSYSQCRTNGYQFTGFTGEEALASADANSEIGLGESLARKSTLSDSTASRHIAYILAHIRLCMAKIYLYHMEAPNRHSLALHLLIELKELQYIPYMPEIAYQWAQLIIQCPEVLQATYNGSKAMKATQNPPEETKAMHDTSETNKTLYNAELQLTAEEMALIYYEDAAKAGYIPALLKLGAMYQDRGCTDEVHKAQVWLHKAAQYNSPEAYGRLGRLYSDWEMPEVFDKTKALYWGLKGLDVGNEESLFVLINIFVWGLNGAIEPDYKAAVEILEERAKEQSLFLFLLGKMYVTGGYGIFKDMTKGLSYLEAAAKLGHLEAAYVLGTTAASIDMIVPNYEVALFWLRHAVTKGHVKARDALRQVEAQCSGKNR